MCDAKICRPSTSPAGSAADASTGKGKLRLLYEASPLAFVAKHAGGYASTGYDAILDIDPDDLHQRVPLIIGNRDAVEFYEQKVKEEPRPGA